MSIDSCSLYEFRITAVSRYGESKPVYLVQYTGSFLLFIFKMASNFNNKDFNYHCIKCEIIKMNYNLSF